MMIFKSNRLVKRGFSLLEMTIVLIITTVLLSAAIPQFVNGYMVKAANKTALDMSAIEEASRAYYVQYNTWPASITVISNQTPPQDLESNGYLPQNWSAVNPFGNSVPAASQANYSYMLVPDGSGMGASLLVATYVPNTNAQTIIENLLPASWVDPKTNIVYSTVTVPGSASVMPTGSIIAWPGTTAPQGFLLCDGSIYNTSTYSNLASVLGSVFGGNGTNTFAVPDLRGRGIVGLNQISVNDGSDRIWWTDNYSNNLGQAASYNVNQIGGVFGEEKHRQTLVEMAPHTHPFASWDYVKGFSGNSTSSPRDPQGGNTGSAGGNGDGTGLGAAANIVSPSVALEYIIKY